MINSCVIPWCIKHFVYIKNHQNSKSNRHSENKIDILYDNENIMHKYMLHENVYISEKKTGNLETNSEI